MKKRRWKRRNAVLFLTAAVICFHILTGAVYFYGEALNTDLSGANRNSVQKLSESETAAEDGGKEETADRTKEENEKLTGQLETGKQGQKDPAEAKETERDRQESETEKKEETETDRKESETTEKGERKDDMQGEKRETETAEEKSEPGTKSETADPAENPQTGETNEPESTEHMTEEKTELSSEIFTEKETNRLGERETEEDLEPKEAEETETEEDSEPKETETDEAEVRYKIFVEESVLFQVDFLKESGEYRAGETVEFQVKAQEETRIAGIEVYPWEEMTAEEIDTDEAAEIFLAENEIAAEYDGEKEIYYFVMPQADAVLFVNVENETMVLDLAEEIEADSFKLVCSKYPDYPHAPDNMQKSSLKLAMTSRKQVIFYKEDGTQIKRTAYCLQPAADSPGSGNTYESNTAVEITDATEKERMLKKALYYLYGGPAWGISVSYEDGSGSANLKELLNNGGKDCTTDDQYYCLAHYILSYIYLGENGKWNYMYTTAPEGPVLNSYGVSVVKKLVSEIEKLPLAEANLSKNSVTSRYDGAQGYSVSESLSYQAIKENTAEVTLPEGIVLVNETSGTRTSGIVTLHGGDQFHLEASSSVNGAGFYTFQTAYAADFTAMKLIQKGNYQDVGFSYYSGKKALTLQVQWPQQGRLKIRKIDGETGKTENYNAKYAMAQAVYGVYSDRDCTRKVTELVTGEDGCAQTVLPLGNYYLKEEKAPAGFYLNTECYEVSLTIPSQEVEAVASDWPVKKRILVKKTGDAQLTLQGAEYTVYRDADCSVPAETLVIDENGEALTGELRLDTYYVKETKAPEGYLCDPNVYTIEMNQSDAGMTYEIVSQEEIIRGSLALMKYLDDDMEESVLQDLYEKGTLEGIRFTLTHENASVDPVVIVTDRYGYAATAPGALIYGTWYLSEDPETTPEGYEGIQNVKIQILEDGTEKMYVVTNKPYEAYLCIQKRDKDSGALICSDQAEFQILDSQGKPVCMPTFDGYTDTFRTNEKGEIHLTKALKGGTYQLKETKAPEGYQLAAPITFTVKKNFIYQEPLILECLDEPNRGVIRVTKRDEKTQTPCGAGFVFQIKAAEDILDGGGNLRREVIEDAETELKAGTIVEVIVTNQEGIAQSKELYPGKYEICEVLSGEYYACSEESWLVEVKGNAENIEKNTAENRMDETEDETVEEITCFNAKTQLELKKTDAKTGKAMTGAVFALWEKGQEEESVLDKTDETGTLIFENLKHCTVYCIQEKEAPAGYVLDPTVYEITVDENGRIEGESAWCLALSNQPNLIEISKKEIAGREELPGALLELRDADGTLVESWTSSAEAHRISGLPSGHYTLTEITAPMGYEIAESIEFALTDSLEVTQVTMYDRPLQQETETEAETEVQTEIHTEVQTETELQTEKLTEKKEVQQETQKEKTVETGDLTPLISLLVLAVSSLMLAAVEVLRRIY